MHRLKVMLALLLLASCGVPLASAAGTGTFSIEQTTPSVGVGQFGIATLYMDNSWTPPADSVTLTLTYDPTIIQYVSTDWKVGNSVAAEPAGAKDLAISFADFTNKYPTGRVAIAAMNFKGVAPGQSTMTIAISSVRSHVGISETEFTDLTASALANPSAFTVGAGGVVTTVSTIPVTTGTGVTTVTTLPTVTGNVTGGVTTPITIATSLPTTGPTGITTGVPFTPAQGSTGGTGGGSEDYTGVLTRTPTVTATTTATATSTVTATGTAMVSPTMTAGGGASGGNVTTTRTATPGANATGTVGATVTTAATTAGTTAARTTTTAAGATTTRSGTDVLPLAVAGLAGIALLAARRR